MRTVLIILIIVIFVFTNSYAQLSHTFTNTARNSHYGEVLDIAVDSDGTIFLARGRGGLSAYSYDGNTFTNTAHAPIDSGDVSSIAVGSDGTVFLAGYGLRAYTYDGASFTNTAYIDSEGYVAVGPDGTVFLAGGTDIWAYNYNGYSFTNTAHTSVDSGSISDIKVGPDGTVFLAVSSCCGRWKYEDDDGLRAFTYNGNSFYNTAHIDDEGEAMDLALSFDGTVFLANGEDGLRVYSYDGMSFLNTAHDSRLTAEIVAVDSNGTIFVINRDTLLAYSYDGTFLTKTAQIEYEYWNGQDLEVDQDGTVFVANGGDGFSVYNYDSTSFYNLAHINDVGWAYDVAVDSNGIVFLANGHGGLRAYIYNGNTFTNNAHDSVSVSAVAVDRDGTLFTNGLNGLCAYTYNGGTFTKTAYSPAGNEEIPKNGIAVDSNRTVFVVNQSGTLSAYFYDDTSLTKTAQIHNEGRGQGVAVGPDGTVFVARLNDGLRAYSYDGASLINTAHILNNYPDAEAVAVASDGIVFLANECDGLRAYSYDGASFTNTAHINDGHCAEGVAVAADGTVFVNSRDGLRAYSYDGTSLTNTAFAQRLNWNSSEGQSIEIAVGHDGIVFLANDYDGMFAYEYSLATAIDEELTKIPVNYSLSQNFPNPFNPSTTIEFDLPKASDVRIEVYNVAGQKIHTLINEKISAGSHHVEFNAQNLSSGVYFYRIEAGEFQDVKKMILLK